MHEVEAISIALYWQDGYVQYGGALNCTNPATDDDNTDDDDKTIMNLVMQRKNSGQGS